MLILGINAHHPDSSAAIISDGKLIAACEEERFRRVKHFAGFPSESIKYCLMEAGVSIKDIDYIAIPRQPYARIFKKAIYGLKMPSLGKTRIRLWRAIFDVKTELSHFFDIDKKKIKAKIIKVEHHRAHLASSFFTSGFDKAFLFSMDALGDFASLMWGFGEGNRIGIRGEITFPHSLGFYYTALTQYLGFLNFGDEYKVMGLAPYGEPSFNYEFEKILKIKKNGFELDLNYFLHHKKSIFMSFDGGRPEIDSIFSSHLEKRLGKKRSPGAPLEKRHKDIASSLQKRLEDVLMHLLNGLSGKNDSRLCLAGGVSHNSAANGKILERAAFKNIYIPPAPGDAGLSIGAAFYLWNQHFGKPKTFAMGHAYWGPEYTEADVSGEIRANENGLLEKKCKIERMENQELLCKKTAQYIADGKIVGWFQGKMEIGPRALGNRSILADPRKGYIKDVLNERIKYRESFRPFAPSILGEDIGDYFTHTHSSPFMNFVHKIKDDKKNMIPAVSHVDGTARLHTVNKDANPLFWNLINEFKKSTGIPVLLNTSFNENEPIVCSLREAIDCFMRTGMDALAIGPYVITK